MVVFGIGFRPNTSLGQGRLRTFGNGAFLVDRRQETSVPGVYAVGDCATVYNNAIQAADYIALATNAVRSGIIAAHNACGKVLESVGVQGSNGISIWGLHMLSTGISLARAKRMGYDAAAADYEDWQKAEFMENGNHKVKIRIVYDRKSRIILGAQMCSDYDVSMGIHMFSMAVEEQVTIDKLKLFDLFFLPHFNKPYNYVTMAALGAVSQDQCWQIPSCFLYCFGVKWESISLRKEIVLYGSSYGSGFEFCESGYYHTSICLTASLCLDSGLPFTVSLYGLGCWPAWPLRVQTLREEGRTRIFIWILRFTPLFFPLWGPGPTTLFSTGRIIRMICCRYLTSGLVDWLFTGVSLAAALTLIVFTRITKAVLFLHG